MAVDADSASGRIAQAFEAVIRGLKISPAPTNIVRRKLAQIEDGDGSRVVIIGVSDDEQYENLGAGSSGWPSNGKQLWAVKRPCSVALGYISQGKTGNNEALRKARGQIEDAITMGGLQRAGLVGTFCSANDVTPYGRPVFDPRSTPGVDWSVITVTVETLEERPYGI